MRAGDVNGDGKADLVWRHASTGQVTVWLMNGATIAGSGMVAQVTDLDWQLVGAGDVNGDGKADLVWRHASTGQVTVWRMNGATIAGAGAVAQVTDSGWQIY